MNRVPLHGHRGLADDLREGWVGMDGHSELLRGSLDELGEDALGDQVRHVRTYGVHPQDEVGLGVGHNFEEAVGLALDEGLADGPEGELGLLDLVSLLLGLGLGEPEGGDLGPGGVREPVTPDNIPCGVDSVLGGPPVLIDLDDAPVADLHAGHVEVEVLGYGLASDGDQERLGLQGVASFAGLACWRVLAAVRAALALGLLPLAGLGARNLYLHAV